MKKWSELFPEGRHIFYEGDDPVGFVNEMKARFNFDPSQDEYWGESLPKAGEVCEICEQVSDGVTCRGQNCYLFHCPAAIIDDVYGNSKYPMGS